MLTSTTTIKLLAAVSFSVFLLGLITSVAAGSLDETYCFCQSSFDKHGWIRTSNYFNEDLHRVFTWSDACLDMTSVYPNNYCHRTAKNSHSETCHTFASDEPSEPPRRVCIYPHNRKNHFSLDGNNERLHKKQKRPDILQLQCTDTCRGFFGPLLGNHTFSVCNETATLDGVAVPLDYWNSCRTIAWTDIHEFWHLRGGPWSRGGGRGGRKGVTGGD